MGKNDELEEECKVSWQTDIKQAETRWGLDGNFCFRYLAVPLSPQIA